MAERQAMLGPQPKRPELEALYESVRRIPVTEEQLQEQRISFAYGNAPTSSGITKDSIRSAAKRTRMSGD